MALNMNILIAPWARSFQGKPNPKNYPHWASVVQKLVQLKHFCLQISMADEEKICPNILYNQPLSVIEMLIKSCDVWVSIDSFLPHLAYHLGKRGITIWGPSEHSIFSYSSNVNILPRKKTTVPPFIRWDMVTYDSSLFAPPEQVVEEIQKFSNRS